MATPDGECHGPEPSRRGQYHAELGGRGRGEAGGSGGDFWGGAVSASQQGRAEAWGFSSGVSGGEAAGTKKVFGAFYTQDGICWCGFCWEISDGVAAGVLGNGLSWSWAPPFSTSAFFQAGGGVCVRLCREEIPI